MEIFSQMNTFLTMYVVFIQENPFIPKLNAKSKQNFEVLSNNIHRVIDCTENFSMNVRTTICTKVRSEIY